MFGKLSVRNIPEQIFRALEDLATRHDRSTEGEARQAITAWVKPELAEQTRSSRRLELSQRLNKMLDQVNADRNVKLTPSEIAEEIGQEHAEEVENWFFGLAEPSFSQLSAVAAVLGVDPNWLKHGKEKLYPVEYHRPSENPFAACDWLLKWTPPLRGSEGQTLKQLHLVREESRSGSLYLIKESNEGHFVTYTTPVHVSEDIGAGGEAALAALFVTLQLLYKIYTNGSQLTVAGYQLHSDDISQLASGQTNPGSLLRGRDSRKSTWWEDIWHREMVGKHEYWPGWRSLCERIQGVIAKRPYLTDVRARISRGEVTAVADVDAA